MTTTFATFLFADPSLLYGVARIFDFEGRFATYNESADGEEADAIALHYDWAAVGQTLCDAMSKFSAEAQ